MTSIVRRGVFLAVSAFGVACGSDPQPDPSNGAGGSGGSGGSSSPTGGATGSGGQGGTGTSTGGGSGMSSGGSSTSGGSGGSTSSGGTGGVASTDIRWIGRVDASDPAAVKFSWSGTGFVATVTGTKISVSLQTQGDTGTAFYQPVIDGNVGDRFAVPKGNAQTVMLGDNLAAGEHRVELYRESEGMYGYSVFLGFVDGTLVGSPPAPGRLIEIIGDSISAGYGNLGNDVHPPYDVSCGFTLDTQSAYQAFSWKLARALDADVSIIARSGWGIVRDNTGNTSGVLSAVYGNTLGTQATPAWTFPVEPDVVLINLGTNDSGPGDPGQPYEDAYVELLGTVRSHYPNAWIFLTIGTMTGDPMLTTMRTHLANVIADVGDAKIVKVDLTTQNTAMTGCDYHPNVAEDERIATALETAIAAQLGW